jgi:hypothetical protein
VKKPLVYILVAALLVTVAIFLRGREQQRPATPEAAVNAFFEAAARGDDRAYLDLVAGPLRAALEETRSGVGPEKFRQGLKDSATGLKGLAITAGRDAPPDQVALDVELVFADRNERQRMLLVPQGAAWVIVSMSAASGQKPAIPYGTPVYGSQP